MFSYHFITHHPLIAKIIFFKHDECHEPSPHRHKPNWKRFKCQAKKKHLRGITTKKFKRK